MVKHFTREVITEQTAIVAKPRIAHQAERSFELPEGLYVATVGLYLGFLAVMAAGLSIPAPV